MAELLSGGYLLATPHRVLSPSAPRLSVPFFFNPALETTVEELTLPSSLPWERDGPSDGTHWRRPSNAMLREYGVSSAHATIELGVSDGLARAKCCWRP